MQFQPLVRTLRKVLEHPELDEATRLFLYNTATATLELERLVDNGFLEQCGVVGL